MDHSGIHSKGTGNNRVVVEVSEVRRDTETIYSEMAKVR